MQRKHRVAAVLAGIALCAVAAQAQQHPVPMATADLDLSDLIEVKIQVASGRAQSLSRAPAVASVITAEHIHAMGATTLNELLETVAGLHVTPSKVGNLDPRYSIRGIESNTAGGMLVLLNGIPITRAAEGTPILGFQLPVTGIERVEIIRGPGSAIYGADAIGGVIDIITKNAADIGGTRVGLRAGSFDSRDGWFQHGARWGEWDLALTLDLRKTDGDDGRVIERDRQSDLDELFGTSASLAPGPIDSRAEIANLHLQLQRSGWTAHLWGFRNERGVGVGLAQALDPGGGQESKLLMADLSYATTLAGGDWELTQTLSHIDSRTDTDFNIFPPRSVLLIGADGNVDFTNPVAPIAFPDGLITRPGVKQRTLSFDSVAFFSGLERHSLRFNLGLERDEFEATDRRNFGPGVIDGSEGVVGGTLTDLSGTGFAFSPDVDRDHWYLSFQDQWQASEKVELTLGARYDKFSDFGGSFNPRLALVWLTHPKLSTKLLYGRAFRAPSFAQLFTSNNPSFLGNPELKPETSETLEVVLDGRPRPRLRTVLSAYYYEVKDMIGLLPDPGLPSFTAQNAARQQGYGFELELAWEASDVLRLQSNYAWLNTETAGIPEGTHAPNEAPQNQFYLGADWRFQPRWSGFLRINRVGHRDRLPGDARQRVRGYTTVDLTLRRERLWAGLDIAFLGRNLLDEAGREPADPALRNDYPIQGRMLAVEISYRLR